MPDAIIIRDLRATCRVGVPEAERAHPQELLVSIEMAGNFSEAAATDDLARTIDYDAVCRRVIEFTRAGSWKLIERLAEEIARLILEEFPADEVSVELKKFVIPEANYVGVRLTRRRGSHH